MRASLFLLFLTEQYISFFTSLQQSQALHGALYEVTVAHRIYPHVVKLIATDATWLGSSDLRQYAVQLTWMKIRELVDSELLPLHNASVAESMGDPLGAVPLSLALHDDGQDLREEHSDPVVPIARRLRDEVLESVELFRSNLKFEVVPLVLRDLGPDSGRDTGEEERRDRDPRVSIEDDLSVRVWALRPPADEPVVELVLVPLEEGYANLLCLPHLILSEVYLLDTRKAHYQT